MRRTLVKVRHEPDTAIRVQFWRLTSGETGLDVSVLRDDGRKQHLTFFNPQDVTDWFLHHSRRNVETWREAFHHSGLTAKDFHRPDTKVGGTYTVRDETELYQVTRNALGDASRWPQIWVLNPDIHHETLKPGQELKLPGDAFRPGASGTGPGDVVLKVPYITHSGTTAITRAAPAMSPHMPWSWHITASTLGDPTPSWRTT